MSLEFLLVELRAEKLLLWVGLLLHSTYRPPVRFKPIKREQAGPSSPSTFLQLRPKRKLSSSSRLSFRVVSNPPSTSSPSPTLPEQSPEPLYTTQLLPPRDSSSSPSRTSSTKTSSQHAGRRCHLVRPPAYARQEKELTQPVWENRGIINSQHCSYKIKYELLLALQAPFADLFAAQDRDAELL